LNISKKDLADLTYSGLSLHLREKQENHVFSDVSQVLQRALDCESRSKESRSVTRSGDKPRNDCPVNMVECGSKSSDDEKVDMYIAEWNWASKSKPFICSSLKTTSKSRQDEIHFTFDVTKCDRIFDYLLQEKQIKLSCNHVIPSLEQLKKYAYCKWYNSYSHTTNDCNIFRRQVQSAINEGQLKFIESPQMKPDKDIFLTNMNTVKLDGKKVLVWPSQSKSTKAKQIVIGEERHPGMIRPKNPKIGRWKKNERNKSRSHPKATFNIVMAKYRDGRASIRDRKN
jgi:hypothetical protein